MSSLAAPPRSPQAGAPRQRAPVSARTTRTLGQYRDGRVTRQIVALPREDGTALVIDWIAGIRTDPRVVAEIAADEPAGNAALIADIYRHDPSRGICRRLRREDLHPSPSSPPSRNADGDRRQLDRQLRDREGRVYRLRRLPGAGAAHELRWTRRQHGEDGEPEILTLRSVVGALESYEPARTITATAIDAHRHDPHVSIEALRLELRRLADSSTVLNRGLREAVQAHVEAGILTMSEIAIRCERVKHHPAGQLSGETSWLARRIGVAAESGHGTPTPWVHTDVLALIARSGLHVCPREVELG